MKEQNKKKAVRINLDTKVPTLGFVYVDREHTVQFANDVFKRLAQVDSPEGLAVHEFLRAPQSEQEIDEQLARRAAGEGDVYEIALRTPHSTADIPVQVSALPTCDEYGKSNGSIALVKDLRPTKAAQSIAEIVSFDRAEKDKDWLAKVAVEIKRVIPFDLMTIWRLAKDGVHTGHVFTYAEHRRPSQRRQWHRLPPYMQEVYENPEFDLIENLEAKLTPNQLNSLRKYAPVKQLVRMGPISTLRRRVSLGNRPTGLVTLFRKRDHPPFTTADKAALDMLPIGEVVRSVVSRIRERNDEFRLLLIDKLLQLDAIDEIAKTLVKELAEHYGWKQVALLRVEHEQGTLRLEAQWPETYLPKDHKQDIQQGLIGSVAKSGTPLKVDDVENDRRYLATVSETRSEFCVPLKWARKVRWVLDVQHTKPHAFSIDEFESIKIDARKIQKIVGSMIHRYQLHETYWHSKSGIFFTDYSGLIERANLSGRSMISSGVGSRIIDFLEFDDGSRADSVEDLPSEQEMRLIVEDDANHPVLVSRYSLPSDVTGHVFVISDLAPFKKIQELESIRSLFYNAAEESQPPLALAYAWLEQLLRRKLNDLDSDTRKTISESLLELRKAGLTYERLMLTEQRRERKNKRMVPLHLGAEVDKVLRTLLTREEFDNVEFKNTLPRDAMILGDRQQLEFVLRVVTSLLGQRAGSGVRMEVDLRVDDGFALAEFCNPDLKTIPWRFKSWSPRLSRVIANHSGTLDITDVNHVKIAVPLASEEWE